MSALSQRDRDGIFEVCAELLKADDQDDLLACATGSLRGLLTHESFACGIGRLDPDGLTPRVIISHQFPDGYLKSISARGRIRPQTFRQWSAERKPMAINFAQETETTLPNSIVQAARRFGFYNMICHGQVDLDQHHMSYVTFNRIPEQVRARHQQIAAHVMPHLHNCLVRIGRTKGAGAIPRTPDDKSDASGSTLPGSVTERQMDILQLIALGKTNWEIGQILNTSVDNVKYHIKRLAVTFGANSRTAIIAHAIQRGIIPSQS